MQGSATVRAEDGAQWLRGFAEGLRALEGWEYGDNFANGRVSLFEERREHRTGDGARGEPCFPYQAGCRRLEEPLGDDFGASDY